LILYEKIFNYVDFQVAGGLELIAFINNQGDRAATEKALKRFEAKLTNDKAGRVRQLAGERLTEMFRICDAIATGNSHKLYDMEGVNLNALLFIFWKIKLFNQTQI
jgi:hypothetical protein